MHKNLIILPGRGRPVFGKTDKNSPPPLKQKLQEQMRPVLSENEKRNQKLIIRVNKDEKLRIKTLTRSGGYPCMSDFIRNRIFRRLDKRTATLDNETSQQLKEMDYELNKVGINLNQLSRRMNSFAGYNIGDNDRQLLRQAFEMMTQCLAFLQKYLR